MVLCTQYIGQLKFFALTTYMKPRANYNVAAYLCQEVLHFMLSLECPIIKPEPVQHSGLLEVMPVIH